MRPPALDPTAGATARAIRAHPETPRRIDDPTDPRCGESTRHIGERVGDQLIWDPTDPEYGERAA